MKINNLFKLFEICCVLVILMRNRFFLFLLFCSLIFFFGCEKENVSDVDSKISIVTTIFPLYDFVRIIGGEKVSVSLLLLPGVEAHSFELKPSDIKKIQNADIFVCVGGGMEPWVDDVLDVIDEDKVSVVFASSFVDLISSDEDEPLENEDHKEHHHGNYDPHIWLDLENDQKIERRESPSHLKG